MIAPTESFRLRKVLPLLKLEDKPRCTCIHGYEAWFETPGKTIRVSFCDHCFDVVQGDPPAYNSPAHYRMPPGFYADFVQRARAAGWKVADPVEPKVK